MHKPSEPAKPYHIGTRVIVVRAMRVMNNAAAPLVIGEIGAKLEPHNGELRYTIKGDDQLVYFHREIFAERMKAVAAINVIRIAEEKRVADAIAIALEKAMLADMPE